MTASLSIRPAPEIGADVRFYEVDCRNGTTSAFSDGPPTFLYSAIVGYLLSVHHDRERGAGTSELRERYGLKSVSE